MPKYLMTYAYDVPHYADFIVEARTRGQALDKAEKQMRAGKFRGVEGTAYSGQADNHRIVLRDESPREGSGDDPTMEELIGIIND